jgi:adenylosuccinate synthase
MINYADVIVDLQQGDSGKGKIASLLASKGDYTHVIRYNGSNNAGHTIYIDGQKFVTHSIPVGALHGLTSIIGPGCVLNVAHFFRELKTLEDQGLNVKRSVKIATNVHIITDSHLDEDRTDTKVGTTRRGNGPAYRDKYDRKGIRACDISELRPYLVDIYEELHGQENCKILFEGAQGFYLDVDWGDYPYVTSSHCTVGSAVMNGVPPQKIRKIYGAAKIYETYVGAKKFEQEDSVFQKIREIGNEYGATTGRPRQCNWLNIDNLKRAIDINGVTDLIISKVDVLRSLGIWRVYEKNELKTFMNENETQLFLKSRVNNVQIHWSDDPVGTGNII